MHISDLLAVTVATILAVSTTSVESKVVEHLEESVTITVYYESMCPTSI